jgi:hypothetical protein
MWTISCSQLLGDECSSQSLLIEIEKGKNSRTPAHTLSHTRTRHAHTHEQPHTTPRHAHAHTAHTPGTAHTRTAQHAHHTHSTQRTWEKIEGKRGQFIQTIIFRSWSYCLSQTHLLSSKGRVQLHGGAANWWSCCSRVGLVEPEPSQTRP